jgi:hypothetical protein
MGLAYTRYHKQAYTIILTEPYLFLLTITITGSGVNGVTVHFTYGVVWLFQLSHKTPHFNGGSDSFPGALAFEVSKW